ncbi:hypothetical protein [Rhizorhabdus dicambivorans]|nr:hypothetical protein [Rhizorhabdus dicambivorans]
MAQDPTASTVADRFSAALLGHSGSAAPLAGRIARALGLLG